MTSAALPHLLDGRRRRRSCASGTRAALQPFSGAAGYISSKAAVIAFAQAVAVEYKDDGIRCNAILPSVIDTPANRASMPNADHEKWVKPAQIAGVIAHLLSDDVSGRRAAPRSRSTAGPSGLRGGAKRSKPADARPLRLDKRLGGAYVAGAAARVGVWRRFARVVRGRSGGGPRTS